MREYAPRKFSGVKICSVGECNLAVISHSGENTVDIQVLTNAIKLQTVIKIVLESSSK